MKNTLEQLAVIERRDAWIRRLSQVFFAVLFALVLTSTVVGALAVILNGRESTQRDSRAAATRRIDQLQSLVGEQAMQIASLSRQVGQLTTAQAALVAQLRQNQIVPVVVASPVPTKTQDPQPSPTAGPRSSPTSRPSSTPRPSGSPKPSPSPSPSCLRLPIVGCP